MRVRGVGLVTSAVVAVAALMFVTTAEAGAVVQAGAVKPAAEPTMGPASFDRTFTHGKVDVDGGTIHYVIGGSGPAVVLLHGWPQTWWAWHKVMPDLARKHTVIAVDLPGLGDSTVPTGGFDKVTTARRVRQAVNKLGFQQVTLIGHDVGVLVAYPYARDYPNEVTRVIALESPLSGFGLEEVYGVSFHFGLNMAPYPIPETIVDSEDVKTYLGMIFDFSLDRSTVDRDAYYKAYSDPNRRHAGYEYYRAYPGDAANNRANANNRLQMPVLAMGAQYVFGPGVAASFRQVADNVHEVVAPNTLHFIPEEVPTFLVDCVSLFLGDTSGDTRPELAGCIP
ncbi:MAG TPA: alpha/beta hydrolase [Micromonosporaceae bacterium]